MVIVAGVILELFPDRTNGFGGRVAPPSSRAQWDVTFCLYQDFVASRSFLLDKLDSHDMLVIEASTAGRRARRREGARKWLISDKKKGRIIKRGTPKMQVYLAMCMKTLDRKM